MCGIIGILNFSSTVRDERPDLIRARDRMTHRGPDDAGIFVSEDRRVALGHRRLSIVDLSENGRQPMGNEDRTVWITCNGEIYNHIQLRKNLMARGHRFGSGSDSETIIHLYEELGRDVVGELDGMFAFAIWDETRKQILLVRDRLGKKPLYYTVAAGRLLFASELKALLALPGVSREIDLKAMGLFLTFSNVPAPWTLFRGIRKLPAGHFLTGDLRGDVRVERYWSPLDCPWPDQGAISESEAVEEIRRLLNDAVAKRLMADVPVGCFLSGGVDSSTSAALMSRLMDRPLKTFSVGFEGFGPEQDFHDLPYASLVARHFGCEHREVIVSARECRNYLPEMVHDQDEPNGDPACLPMHFLSRGAAESGIKVVLVGEGSDEVFGGYDLMRRILQVSWPRWKAVRRLPRNLRRGLHEGVRILGHSDVLTDLLRRSVEGEPFYWGLNVAFWETTKRKLLTESARPEALGESAEIVRGYYDRLLDRQPRADLLQQVSFVELCNRLPELLLMRVDKITMAHSVEARAPFLDHRLSAFALSLPQRLKISGGETKAVLKKAMEPILPAGVIRRKKQGFRVPLKEWLADDMASWAERLLFESPLAKRGFFNREFVDGMWRKQKHGSFDHSWGLWCLLNLSAWYEHWIEGKSST